ncbi:hypothetical protein PRJ39_16085 [Lysobacter enzymogenes]|uniref:hypothetical protein n=1 Tax=Lysobacter enzymogenes TaxID=69 RepID=UPI0037489A74
MKVFAALAAGLLLTACASAPAVREQAAASPCLPGGAQCAIYDFAMADERVLRANGEAIEVECPWTSDDLSAEQRQARCAGLIEMAANLIAQRLSGVLGEIRPEQVDYRDSGECVDINGRVGSCYRKLRAQVPLPWIVPRPGAAAADPGLR